MKQSKIKHKEVRKWIKKITNISYLPQDDSSETWDNDFNSVTKKDLQSIRYAIVNKYIESIYEFVEVKEGIGIKYRENNLSILTIDEETSDFSQDKINITINACSITYKGLEYLNFIRTSCFKWTPIFISSISLILSIITIA